MATVKVAVLGTVAARTEAGLAPIPGEKQQALTALLALAVPHPVSDDRILDQVWGEDLPSKPANALQAQVSQLRRVLGRDVVTREVTGYALRLDADAVDALLLERLVGLGRAASAAGEHGDAERAFAEAIGLVRGPPLADLADHPFARDAAVRLNDLVLDAHEGAVDVQLATGRHLDAVPGLQALVAAHPLRERFHAQLVTALYRCGRQADALAAYQDVRRVLGEELGLDPGPELQGLERAVLSQDPALWSPVRLESTTGAAPLAVPMTSFVGRAREVESVDAALATARLVTLTGPAGVGKTRLALEVAAARATAGNEVWFAPLAPVPDPVAVPEAVAAAVGARDEGAGAEAKTAPEDRVADRLGGRAALLVLDNCEHVAAAATSFVAGLLARCPRVVVLATSREPLGISGELQKHVDPLAVADAVTLFADRARAVQERFVVTDEDELAMLCRRLDGLPLAIELAAARTRVLPVAELAARVDDRFRLLTGAGTGDPRHRALVAAIDASYDLLFDDERRAFRRLSVFAGGAPLSVATEVCGPDALDLVTRLVDRSLLVADLSGREARYRMLESLRAYGRDRLVDEGELDDAMRALVSWSRDVAHQAAVAVRSAGQLDHLARLDVEHDNLRAALAWAVTGAPDDGLALVGWLLVPWFVHGRPQEARHWAEACLAAAVDPRPDDLARVLAYVGLIAEAPGWTGQPGAIEEQLATAEGRQRRAIGLADELGDDLLRADAQLVLLATLARRASMGMAVDRDQVVPIVRDAVAAFEAHDDQYGAGCVRSTEAIFGIVDGDEAAVALAIERTRAHVARSGDRFGASRVEWLLGIQARAAGDPALAYRHVERSIRLLDELGMAHAVTSQAEVLAQLAQAAGEDALAAQWRAFVRARRGGTTLLDSSIAAASRNRAGLAARSAGSPDEARTAHLEALALYEEAGSASGIAFTQSCLGFLDGDQTRHQQALTAAVDAGDPVALALALLGIASGFGPGEEAWAAVLLGAAAARWPSAGPPSHREDLDAVRAALGDGWAVEEAVGSVLSSDELLATVRLRRLVRA